MAMYLGSQKVCPVIKIDSGGSAVNGILIQSDGSSNTGFILKSVGVINVSAEKYMFNKFYMFDNTITSIDLSSIENISGAQSFAYAFQYCTNVASVNFSSLKTLTGSWALYYAFRHCDSLKNIYFNSLTPDGFGTLTNQFQLMLDGVSGCTVHFPSSLQSVISSWADVQNGFGGTNTTVLFDL